MFQLPNELLRIIVVNLNIFDTIAYNRVNKTNHCMLRDEIRYKLNKIQQIQRFYMKRRVHYPFEETFINTFFEPHPVRRNYIIRTFIACYPSLLLLTYPEFFLEKTNLYNSPEKKLVLRSYIEGLPPKASRTRRHIRDFLNLKCISVRDIVYVGW